MLLQIYIFIAGSYFPWLILERFKYNFLVDILKYLIWILAGLGIIYQQVRDLINKKTN